MASTVAASSYIVETALCKYLLKEHVNGWRWAGTASVAVGIALLSI